jgi:hypothetical protein
MGSLGILITGIVIKKIEGYLAGGPTSTVSAAADTLKKYLPMIAVWLVSYFLFVGLSRLTGAFLPRRLSFQLSAGFLLAVLVQSVLAYLLPSLLISGRGVFKDLAEGLRFGLRHFAVTAGIVFAPLFAVAVLSYFKIVTPLVMRVHPDLVLAVLGIGVIVSVIVDLVITTATTLLFLKEKNS